MYPESQKEHQGVFPKSQKELKGVYPESQKELQGVYPKSQKELQGVDPRSEAKDLHYNGMPHTGACLSCPVSPQQQGHPTTGKLQLLGNYNAELPGT